MRTILTQLALLGMVLCVQAEEWIRTGAVFAELPALGGQLYRNVTITQVTTEDVFFDCTGGRTRLPVDQLNPDAKILHDRAGLVDVLACAIACRKVVNIEYDNGAAGGRLIAPYELMTTSRGNAGVRAWFVSGASASGEGQGERIYLLEKITRWQITNDSLVNSVSEEENLRRAWAWYQWCKANPKGGSGISPAERDRLLTLSSTILAAERNARQAAKETSRPQVAMMMPLYESGSGIPIPVAVAAPVVGALPGRVLESNIAGEFEGFEGEKVFKLMNGQIWQQVDLTYHYHYAYAPRVMIYQASGGTMMKVDGVEKAVRVLQLK